MNDLDQKEEEYWTAYRRSCEAADARLIRIARDDLVIWYSAYRKSLVHRIAWRMINYLNLNAECLEDLVHDGLLCPGGKKEGLVYAIEQFNPTQGVKFVIFARKYIWYAMLHGETARNSLEPYQIRLSKKYRRLFEEFEEKFHRKPVLPELSDFSGISIAQLKRMEQAGLTTNPGSLDEYMEGSSSQEDIERDVADTNALNPEDELLKKEDDLVLDWLSQFLNHLENLDDKALIKSENIIKKIKILSKNEQQVLSLRFLFGMDFEQIASRMGITAGNARTILSRVLDKLKKNLFE